MQSSSSILSDTILFNISSDTKSPLSIVFFKFSEIESFLRSFFLKISPVERWGICKWFAVNNDWVPLPAPGGPKKTNYHLNPNLWN